MTKLGEKPLAAMITDDMVQSLAALAHIEIDAKEAKCLADDLASVLHYMDRLARYDTTAVPPWRPTDPCPVAAFFDGSLSRSAQAKDIDPDTPPLDWRSDQSAIGLSPTEVAVAGVGHFDVGAGLFDAPAVRG